MKLEDQVCSLELSKRLKELGVKQDSLFYRFGDERQQYIFCKYYEQYSPNVNLNMADGYSAFTVAELGEMLPRGICQYDKLNSIYEPEFKTYAVFLPDTKHIITDYNEANARAKMLIYLLEKKIIDKERVNET